MRNGTHRHPHLHGAALCIDCSPGTLLISRYEAEQAVRCNGVWAMGHASKTRPLPASCCIRAGGQLASSKALPRQNRCRLRALSDAEHFVGSMLWHWTHMQEVLRRQAHLHVAALSAGGQVACCTVLGGAAKVKHRRVVTVIVGSVKHEQQRNDLGEGPLLK